LYANGHIAGLSSCREGRPDGERPPKERGVDIS
jgi:hypothetical protein